MMGFKKSYFGTNYDLPSIEFALSERKEAINLLTKLWLKDSKKVEFASEFLVGGETVSKYLRTVTMVIFDEIFKTTPELPQIVTAREVENRYKTAYQLCQTLSQIQFAQGNFLTLRMTYDNRPDLREEGRKKSSADESIWAMGDFLFNFWQEGILSIYTPEVQALFALKLGNEGLFDK